MTDFKPSKNTFVCNQISIKICRLVATTDLYISKIFGSLCVFRIGFGGSCSRRECFCVPCRTCAIYWRACLAISVLGSRCPFCRRASSGVCHFSTSAICCATTSRFSIKIFFKRVYICSYACFKI